MISIPLPPSTFSIQENFLNDILTDTCPIGCGLIALEGDLSSIVAGLKLKSLLKCSSVSIPSDAVKKVGEGLENSADPASQLAALLAAGLMEAKGLDKAKIDQAAQDLLNSVSSDGFKTNEEMENGSGYFTGLLLEALSLTKPFLVASTVEEVSGGAASSLKSYLASGAVQDDATLTYPHLDSTVNDYISTATLLHGILKLNAAFGTRLTFNDEKVNKLTRFFLARPQVASVDEVYAVMLGLHTLNAEKTVWRKALVLTASTSSLKASAKGDDSVVRFQVTDAFGAAPSQLPKLFLASLSSTDAASTASPLITNQEIAFSESAKAFEFNLLAIKPAPGNYKLVLSVTPKKAAEGTKQQYAAIQSSPRFVKVISSIEISDLSVSARTEDAAPKLYTYTYDASKPATAKLDVASTDVLEFSFHVKSKASNKAVTVQQAFVLIAPKDDPENVFYYIAKYEPSKKSYSVTASISKQIARVGGGKTTQFTLKLLIGDSYVDNSIAWNVADVNVKIVESKDAKEKEVKDSKKKDSKSEGPSGVASYKPEIIHQYRPADRRAPVSMSSLFTILTLAPISVFVIGILFVGLNFGNCPSGLGVIFALAFHAGIVVIAYIIVLFFLRNNLFETLKLLCYAVPPTFFVGQRALRSIAAKRASNLQAPSS